MAEIYKRKPNTFCLVCKKPIYKRPSQIRFNDGKVYCGQACFGASCRKETPCVVCGKLILAGLNKKTCSRACSNTYRTGIKYKLGRPRKDKVKYQQGLKLRLLEERGERCERCGFESPEILEVHHKNRDRQNNSMGNLELICPNCHATEHFLEKLNRRGGREV